MDQQLHEEALRSPQLSNHLITTLKEWLEYSSISFVNDTVFVLKIIRKRIERGDHIVLEETGSKLTQRSFKNFLKDNFSSYITSEVFAADGQRGEEKIYFQLESCEGGYNLILANDGTSKTYEWISSLSERFSLVYMIATGIVHIKDVRKGIYSPFISEHGKYCRYDKELGKLVEI